MSDIWMYVGAALGGFAIAWKEDNYPANVRMVIRPLALKWAGGALILGAILAPWWALPWLICGGYLARLFYFDMQVQYDIALRAVQEGNLGAGSKTAPAPQEINASAALLGNRADPES